MRKELQRVPPRPSIREIDRKIQAAIEAVENDHYFPADAAKSHYELEELDLWEEKEIKEALLACLGEITSQDYCGRKPPERSREEVTWDCEMFAFSWDSKRFKRRMYLKYCLEDDSLYYVSWHESNY